MSETDFRLDDKYLTGVYNDLETGDFCRFVRTEEGVGLVEPDGDDSNPYYIFEEEYDDEVDIADAIETDFRPVSDEAVEDPASVVERAVRIVSRNDVNEMAGIPFQEAIDLRYARQQVEIVEQ